MASRARSRLLLPVLVACAGAFWLAWQALETMAFTDYEIEAEPALDALRNGHVARFLADAPAYGGSLVLRAPFALLPNLWDGGALALFRMMALPCLVAGALLGVVLWARARDRGHGQLAAWLALVLCAANPLTIRALEIGHPEELLVGAMVVFAGLAAYDGRPALTGVLLGLACAAKPWAVVAIVPLLALLPARRMVAVGAALLAGALLTLPLLIANLGDSGTSGGLTSTGTSTGVIFQPWQAWWFFAKHGELVMGTYAPHYGYRAAPSWIGPVAHPFLVAAIAALSLAWWRFARPADRRLDGLLLLALALLLRCLLDPWNTSYYEIPFLLAFTAWEVHARRGPPLLALAATALAWLTLTVLPRHITPDMQSLAFLAWSVPLAVGMVVRLFAPARFARALAPARDLAARRLPTLAGPTTG
jgi:hypothetical protein